VLSYHSGQAADADPVLLSQITADYASPIVGQELLDLIGSQTVFRTSGTTTIKRIWLNSQTSMKGTEAPSD
jgi:hypothetical protein